jgi:L-ascorbate metabolism protein UlaG (beta-lactamase superfamily)
MMIRWHGHACFEIADSKTVVIDPHDGKSIGIPVPNVTADIVLITHDHFDHNASRVVGGNPIVIKSFVGKKDIDGIKLYGIEESHDEVGGAKRGKISIYRIEMDGMVFTHMGDIGRVPPDEVIKELKGTDILFIPVGNVFTVGADDAWKITELISPKVVVPMHYRIGGLSLSIKPINGFLKKMPEDRIIRVGNSVDFEKEDLPDELEMWVFSI